MRVLGLDSTLDSLGVALVTDGAACVSAQERMTRGQAERIAPLVEAQMRAAGWAYAQLDRIAVTIGPGSFTGVRVGLAFARGLALAINAPCVGISTLEALALENGSDDVRGGILESAGAFCLALYRDGGAMLAPQRLDAAATEEALRAAGPGLVLRGPGAARWAELPGIVCENAIAPDPAALARLGATRDPQTARPDPLYLRAALA